MRVRPLGVVLAAVLLASTTAVVLPVHAATPVIVAVLDTGIRDTSHEFAPGQVVAWRDFINGRGYHYDDHGHGTMTASMVGGLNVSSVKTPSFAPGVRLAIGKVVDSTGFASDAALVAGIAWAVNVGASIISISLADSQPLSTLRHDGTVKAALAAARQAGVLVAVANGNGLEDASLPGLIGPFQADGASPDVLAVGAAGADGLLVTSEPEVVAQYTVTGPSNQDDTSYATQSGTSFSTPLVAGFLATALAAARAYGHNPGADDLEALAKGCARDSMLIPPSFEGYGTIDGSQLQCATSYASGGTTPKPNGVNKLWVETVSGTLRARFG